MSRIFTFVLRPEAARRMNRESYKTSRSWLRRMRRLAEAQIDEKLAEQLCGDLVCYGHAVYCATTNSDGSLKMERISPYESQN